ncbi:MAG: VOC family protein [Bacteroidetes bacterium]|nr:VOC family protein [Bacteroidota bacterium]
MTQLQSYLSFNGNCLEAMQFYQQALGGQLTLQTLGDSPMTEGLPERMKTCILQAALIKDGWALLGSDMVSEGGLVRGNAISICLNCSSEEEIRLSYARLADGGQATHPLENTHWGTLFGGLTDKFGNHWLLQYDQTKHWQPICEN